MKKLSDTEVYKLFKPELSPKKMLELGVFGGSYFGNDIKEYPRNWFYYLSKTKVTLSKAEAGKVICKNYFDKDISSLF